MLLQSKWIKQYIVLLPLRSVSSNSQVVECSICTRIVNKQIHLQVWSPFSNKILQHDWIVVLDWAQSYSTKGFNGDWQLNTLWNNNYIEASKQECYQLILLNKVILDITKQQCNSQTYLILAIHISSCQMITDHVGLTCCSCPMKWQVLSLENTKHIFSEHENSTLLDWTMNLFKGHTT